MRTWQELTAEAEATGTFASYVGDGASVPWQVAGTVYPPFGFTFWFYKLWLDSRYPDAFKLHDWLYTPYGTLIAATRPESDLALRAKIESAGGIFANFDASVVYNAVNLFGGPYFGVSQVGFDGGTYQVAAARLSGSRGGPNMPQAGGRGLNVSIKVVALFQQVTVPGGSSPSLGLTGRSHIGGWSESFWWGADTVEVLWSRLTGTGANAGQFAASPYALARAALLNAQASIVGFRLYQGGAGKGQFRAWSQPGTFGTCDVPQLSLLVYFGLQDTTSTKRQILRGLPDSAGVGGEFSGDSQWTRDLKKYGTSMSQFQGPGQNAVTVYSVFGITAAGIVTLSGAANPFSIGNIITFRNVRLASGQRIGGEFRVSSLAPGGTQFTIDGWSLGAGEGGDVRIPIVGLHGIIDGSLTVSRLLVRKVGRPFEQYRGRRSNRP